MLEQIDLTKTMEKEAYREEIAQMELTLARLQRACKEQKIPVIIIFEGFDAAGKGLQINKLIHPLDPRGFHVYAMKKETKTEQMYPFLWRFWTKTPEKGRIAIFDTSWYRHVSVDFFEKKLSKEERNLAYQEINTFERTLTDDGAVLIKLFLHISKKDQKKRFEKLLESKETAWRVSREDLERNKNYDGYKSILENMLEQTETEYAPWTIVEATDKKYATAKIYATVIHQLEEALKKRTVQKEEKQTEKQEKKQKLFEASVLSNADLSCSYTKEEYKERLQKLQKRIAVLHSELYRRRIPVVLGFEGWDAGGKGGAIKRLTEFMDPRGYVVNPTAAPTEVEKNHHYLWRFWQNMPKAGHIAIFDRTWYGRVMVERLEGFCSENDWKRAYNEMNEFEKELSDWGAVIIKFWVQIDKDTQLERFNDRQNNPEKRWKITDEDWRNREKWDQYEDAVNEMLKKTSTAYAPWHILESVDKKYARIKALKIVIKEIEKALK